MYHDKLPILVFGNGARCNKPIIQVISRPHVMRFLPLDALVSNAAHQNSPLGSDFAIKVARQRTFAVLSGEYSRESHLPDYVFAGERLFHVGISQCAEFGKSREIHLQTVYPRGFEFHSHVERRRWTKVLQFYLRDSMQRTRPFWDRINGRNINNSEPWSSLGFQRFSGSASRLLGGSRLGIQLLDRISDSAVYQSSSIGKSLGRIGIPFRGIGNFLSCTSLFFSGVPDPTSIFAALNDKPDSYYASKGDHRSQKDHH